MRKSETNRTTSAAADQNKRRRQTPRWRPLGTSGHTGQHRVWGTSATAEPSKTPAAAGARWMLRQRPAAGNGTSSISWTAMASPASAGEYHSSIRWVTRVTTCEYSLHTPPMDLRHRPFMGFLPQTCGTWMLVGGQIMLPKDIV
jgi:hypothetical protein